MNTEPIAIIGMGCRFPKAPNPDAFWEMLEAGVDAITEAPARWDVDALYHPLPRTPGRMCTRWGGFLEDVDGFDPLFFRIMPSRAGRIDPQHRLVLEVAWEALEHAGIDATGLAGSATGVFIGISHSDHDRLLYQDRLGIDGHNGPNTYHCFAANRLSYFLNVRGPSMAVDTACSSSLVAVHLACQSLRSGETDLALAGGVNLNLTPEEFVALSFLGVLSADGRCKTFDARADGYGRGEGCGIVVLKRLADALAARDAVLAVIRGSAVNHGGLSNGITAPNGAAQQEVLRRALAAAAVDPDRVSLVEAMGTGTGLGDQIEMAALKAVYMKNRAPDQPLWIGAVKTNIGHLEAASGMASLIKVVLALQHRRIPPHLHLRQLNPRITLDGTSFAIPTRSEPWHPPSGGRLAAVSAFGFGGTNAHMIVEEAPGAEPLVPGVDRPLHVLTLSARTPGALADLARRYLTFVRTHPSLSIADACFTANVGRTHFDHRLAVVTRTTAQLSEQLEAFVREVAMPGLFRGQAGRNRPRLAFVFPARAHHGMARQLYATQPAFRRAFDSCVEGVPVIDEDARIFSIEYALAALWKSWGVEPDVVVGDGPGEYVAACVAGDFTARDGLRLLLGGAATRGGLDTARATDSLSRQRVDFLVTAGASESGDDWTALLNAVAALYVRGAPIDWASFDGEYPRRRLQLPTYPFQRRPCRISNTD